MSQCTATSKSTGQRCGRKASKGLTVCYMHGARSPQAKAAAKRRQAEAKAEQMIARYLKDTPVVPIDDPIRALQDLAADARHTYAFIKQYVADLDREQWTGSDGELSEHIRLLERYSDRLQKFLAEWVRLGLEERLVRLSERQAEAIGRVIDGVLTALDLPPEYHSKAQAELPRQLRLVSRGAA